MLIQFTVENFLSFNGPTTFSMLATPADQQHSDHLVSDVSNSSRAVLPLACIYGATASGRTNLLKAVRFAQALVLRQARSDVAVGLTPFMLGSALSRRSSFEFILQHAGVQYSYGFKIIRERIEEEWLFGRPHGIEVRYFERVTSPQGAPTIELGRPLTTGGAKQTRFIELLGKGTRPHQLFLSEVAHRDVDVIEPVIEWFRDVLVIVSTFPDATALPQSQILGMSPYDAALVNMLKAADIGITNVVTDFQPYSFDRPGNADRVREAAVRESSATVIGTVYEARDTMSQLFEHGKTRGNAQDARTTKALAVQRLAEDGRVINFSIEDESDGMRRLIEIAPALLLLSDDRPHVLFVDDMDNRLHSHVTRRLIKDSLERLLHNSSSQLIFSANDTNLLDLDLMRRDEIWFMEKDVSGASTLYSLVEFKIRPDLKISKGYLNGRFGAIPLSGGTAKTGKEFSHQAGADKPSPVADSAY